MAPLVWLPALYGARLHYRTDAPGHVYGIALCNPDARLWHPQGDVDQMRCKKCLQILARRRG
jgi:hypothetical protein